MNNPQTPNPQITPLPLPTSPTPQQTSPSPPSVPFPIPSPQSPPQQTPPSVPLPLPSPYIQNSLPILIPPSYPRNVQPQPYESKEGGGVRAMGQGQGQEEEEKGEKEEKGEEKEGDRKEELVEEGKEKNMHATRVANLQELLAIKQSEIQHLQTSIASKKKQIKDISQQLDKRVQKSMIKQAEKPHIKISAFFRVDQVESEELKQLTLELNRIYAQIQKVKSKISQKKAKINGPINMVHMQKYGILKMKDNQLDNEIKRINEEKKYLQIELNKIQKQKQDNRVIDQDEIEIYKQQKQNILNEIKQIKTQLYQTQKQDRTLTQNLRYIQDLVHPSSPSRSPPHSSKPPQLLQRIQRLTSQITQILNRKKRVENQKRNILKGLQGEVREVQGKNCDLVNKLRDIDSTLIRHYNARLKKSKALKQKQKQTQSQQKSLKSGYKRKFELSLKSAKTSHDEKPREKVQNKRNKSQVSSGIQIIEKQRRQSRQGNHQKQGILGVVRKEENVQRRQSKKQTPRKKHFTESQRRQSSRYSVQQSQQQLESMNKEVKKALKSKVYDFFMQIENEGDQSESIIVSDQFLGQDVKILSLTFVADDSYIYSISGLYENSYKNKIKGYKIGSKIRPKQVKQQTFELQFNQWISFIQIGTDEQGRLKYFQLSTSNSRQFKWGDLDDCIYSQQKSIPEYTCILLKGRLCQLQEQGLNNYCLGGVGVKILYEVSGGSQ